MALFLQKLKRAVAAASTEVETVVVQTEAETVVVSTEVETVVAAAVIATEATEIVQASEIVTEAMTATDVLTAVLSGDTQKKKMHSAKNPQKNTAETVSADINNLQKSSSK